MSSVDHVSGTHVVPALRYRDVGKAVSWLCTAFGFERHFVAADDGGAVQLAQLTFGTSMVLVAPVRDSALDRLMVQPDEIGGVETQFCYFVVDDADAHCAQAAASGAEIVVPLQDFDYGGRGYTCRDLEGRIWSFGTHDPWQAAPRTGGSHRQRKAGLRFAMVFAGLLAVAAGASAAAWMYAGGLPGALADLRAQEENMRGLQERLAEERAVRERAERALQAMGEQAARERRERETAERAAATAGRDLAREREERAAAERAIADVRAELDQERGLRASAEGAASQAGDALVQARRAREDAERLSREAQTELSRERTARLEVERAAREAEQQLAGERAAREAETAARNAAEPDTKTATGTDASPAAAAKRPVSKRRGSKKPPADSEKSAGAPKVSDETVYEFLSPAQPLPKLDP